MRVSEAMTRDVRIARPDQSIQDAAKMMSDVDAGVLPVGENDQLVGMITDRPRSGLAWSRIRTCAMPA
jgi:CBS domain-containing protein